MKKKFIYQIEVIDDVYYDSTSRLNPFPEDTHAKERLARVFQNEIVRLSVQRCNIAEGITADNSDIKRKRIDYVKAEANEVEKIQRSVKLIKTEDI